MGQIPRSTERISSFGNVTGEYRHWRIQDSTLGAHPFPFPFLSSPFPSRSLISPSLFLSPPFPPLHPLRSRTPLIKVRGSGERLSSPAGPDGARPPNVFWCILGINSHLSECLNDEEFPVFVLRYCWAFYFTEVVPS